ncbi:MAG: hypothetical protein U1E17_13180 [Geminicoccaceae bacterium]
MGALNSIAALGLNAALSQRAQSSRDDDLQKQQARQLRILQLRSAEDQRQQDQALQRRIAQERARAGAAGVGSTGGAADAIVRGLTEEADQATAARGQLLNEQTDAVRDSFRQRRQRNLLDGTERLLSLGRSSGGRSLLG